MTTPTEAAEVGRSHTVGVLQKALDVVEFLVYRPAATLREISDGTGLEKAAVYRILNTLEQRGFTTRDERKRYSPGPRLRAAASALVSGNDVVSHLLPAMHLLRDEFHETVNLGVLSGTEVEYLAIVESQLSLRMTAEVGSTHPARSTALGKAILAEMSDEDVLAAMSDEDVLAAMSESTQSTPTFFEELNRTRDRGYAIDFEENELGAICVAAVVPPDATGGSYAISISGPITRMTPESIDRIGMRLREVLTR